MSLIEEPLLPLTAAAKLVPSRRSGKPTHTSTLHRWATTGFYGVKLETIMIGGGRCTSKAALQRFYTQVTQSKAKQLPVVPVMTDADYRAQASQLYHNETKGVAVNHDAEVQRVNDPRGKPLGAYVAAWVWVDSVT